MVKFTYDGNVGITYDAEHKEELTLEQVRAISLLNATQALNNIAEAITELAQEISSKKFYDEEAAERAVAAPVRRQGARKAQERRLS